MRISCIRENSTQASAAHDRENSRFHDRQSPIFFNLGIYSTLSWAARASRARHIVTSIESVSFKAIVVNLGGFYGVYPEYVCVRKTRVSDGACEDFTCLIFINIDHYDYCSATKKIRYITLFRILYETFDQFQIESASGWTKVPKVSNRDKFEAIRITLKTAPILGEKSPRATSFSPFLFYLRDTR